MNDAVHTTYRAHRRSLAGLLAELESGFLINGAPVISTPDTLRHIKAEVARLDRVIAQDCNA